MTRAWIVASLIASAVTAAVAMIVLGWPEQTLAQQVVLELAPLPLQAALGLGLWQLGRRMRPLAGAARLALLTAAGIGGVGAVLLVTAHLTGPRGLAPAGLAVLWVALLLAMAVVVAHLPPRRLRTGSVFRIEPDPDEDDDAGDAEATRVVDEAPGKGPVAHGQGDR